MQHVAIDLGGRESQVCIRNEAGKIVQETKVATRKLAAFFKQQPSSRVVLETCAEAFRVADLALERGHDVRVVPATLVRSLGVGARSTKTDRRDAQVLSEVSCRIDLPSVHVPTDLARQRRTLCGMREALVSSRTALINNVRGWTRTQLLKLPPATSKTFPGLDGTCSTCCTSAFGGGRVGAASATWAGTARTGRRGLNRGAGVQNPSFAGRIERWRWPRREWRVTVEAP
jgi:transposase